MDSVRERSPRTNGHEAAIAVNLARVRARIAAAAARSGRPADDVRLIAVSKTFGIEAVRAAAAAGQVDFGENRVQEAEAKAADAGSLDVRWHLIGHLQGNKSKKAARLFATIHSLDSGELFDRLDAAADAAGTTPELLVQVDLAGEPTKHGIDPADVPARFAAARSARAVRLVGLMLMPPFSDDPEIVRPYFRRLRELRERLLDAGVDRSMLRELSMGMSHDLDVAIEEGATMVRVGTAIFGQRLPPVAGP